MSIIDWLTAWVEWLRDRAKYIYDWAYKQFTDFGIWVKGYVKWYIDWLKGVMYDNINWLRSIFDNFKLYFGRVYDYLKSLIDWAYNTAINWAETRVQQISSWLESVIKHYYNLAGQYVRSFGMWLKGIIDANFSWLIRYVDNKVSPFLIFINNASCVINFLRVDPIGFIIALLDHFFIDWIQEEIAYQFGSVKTTLPQRRNFFKRICG